MANETERTKGKSPLCVFVCLFFTFQQNIFYVHAGYTVQWFWVFGFFVFWAFSQISIFAPIVESIQLVCLISQGTRIDKTFSCLFFCIQLHVYSYSCALIILFSIIFVVYMLIIPIYLLYFLRHFMIILKRNFGRASIYTIQTLITQEPYASQI